MEPALIRLFGLPRRAKQILLMLADLSCFPVLFLAALALRYDTLYPPEAVGSPLIAALVGTATLLMAGVYRAVVRAFEEKFLQQLLAAVVTTVFVMSLVAGLRIVSIPRSVPFIFGFFMFLWVWATRSAIRRGVRLLERVNNPARRVGIYGAGSAGRQILAALRAAPEYLPVAFFDDGTQMVGTMVQGIRVYRGKDFGRICHSHHLDEVLIALPSVSRARRREVIERIEPFNVRVRTLPGISQLVGDKVSIADIQDVDIGDLLGRDPVPPSAGLLSRDIRGKRVVVTGGGGSIGSELCRQAIAEKPSLLLIWEMNEFALYSIEQELRHNAYNVRVVAVLGSVLEKDRMQRVFEHYKVDTIYHAAAYKHVPLVEYNPFAGVINNALGTYRAALAAIQARVPTFVLVSTDKAVRPTNVMGASKRLAELVLQALAADAKAQTRFCMVRFGNVLGSSGSVVPLFRDQIARGGPITVTHPEVTRYFMTIPEAAQLVIQAGAMGSGGDVFVLDMGEPVKIADLARTMIRLCGASLKDESGEASGRIDIVYSGLRPGEKLYEELLIGDDVTGTDHPKIMRAMESMMPLVQVEAALELLQKLERDNDVARMKRVLADVVEGYTPDMNVEAVGEQRAPLAEVVPLRAGA